MTQDQHSSSEPLWYQATFLTNDDPELVSSTLWDHGAQGVEIRDAQTYFEGAFTRADHQDVTELLAYFELPADESPEALQQSLQGMGAHMDLRMTRFALYLDRTWETAWKDYFHPRALSPRCVVGPPWAEFDAPEGGVKVTIDPGLAFGTGTHETTQLVAQIIDTMLVSSTDYDLLDVGTGSGILAFMAHKLGMKGHTLGVDIDAEAITNAVHNQALNDLVDAPLVLDTTPVEQIKGTYNLVVANILAHILIALAPGIKPRVTPGGTLILSGMLASQVDGVRAAYIDDASVWQELDHQHLGEWHAIVLRYTPAS